MDCIGWWGEVNNLVLKILLEAKENIRDQRDSEAV